MELTEREKWSLGETRREVALVADRELVRWYYNLEESCSTRMRAETMLIVRAEIHRRNLSYTLEPYPIPYEGLK
jgi:hypothetical protein